MKVVEHGRVTGPICVFIGFFLVGLLWTGACGAELEYPTRTITMVLPWPAGGTTDLTIRALAESMQKHLKVPVVVVNKVGGAGTVGGYAIASAKPDGYTLGFFNPAVVIPEAFTYFQEAPYTSKDLKPISAVATICLVMAVREDAPWNSLKELIEYAKKNPGLKVGTVGKQTIQTMFLTTLNKMEKTGFVGVPFAGDAPHLTAFLGNHIPVTSIGYAMVKSYVEAKKVKLLAIISSEKRLDFAPTIPTGVELGYPLVLIPTNGVVGPKGIPEEIVEKLDKLIAKICTEQDFQAKMRSVSMAIDYRNSASYERLLAESKNNVLAFFKEEGLVK